jgi:hypothetical protein
MYMNILKFVAHSKKAIKIAMESGWYPAARYTNLRDIRGVDFKGIGFIDIDWKNYDFEKHIDAVSLMLPKITIARDIESIFDLDSILKEAERLKQYSEIVAIVPKDIRLAGRFDELIPCEYILGYSVPTKYGSTLISPEYFNRPIHLLGGRPEIQRELADKMDVVSIDCNRFTYDARYGDYFDGEIFRPHPLGGYDICLRESIKNINMLWENYNITSDHLNKSIMEVVA